MRWKSGRPSLREMLTNFQKLSCLLGFSLPRTSANKLSTSHTCSRTQSSRWRRRAPAGRKDSCYTQKPPLHLQQTPLSHCTYRKCRQTRWLGRKYFTPLRWVPIWSWIKDWTSKWTYESFLWARQLHSSWIFERAESHLPPRILHDYAVLGGYIRNGHLGIATD